jgi:hypothetical protein
MKFIPFYCNNAHEPKGRGMKINAYEKVYMVKFIVYATMSSQILRP